MIATATNPARTLIAPSGKSVTTALSYTEALLLLKEHGSSFAGDILRKAPSGLTQNQAIFVYILAEEVLARRAGVVRREAAPVPVAGFAAPIFEMFAAAAAKGAKRLRVRMIVGETRLCVKNASETGRNAGSLYVTNGKGDEDGVYYGKIDAAGNFHPSRASTGDIVRALEVFAKDPVAAAKEYGQRTGECCFCGHFLSDDRENRSVTVGYGPICAKKYGLEWG